MGSHSTCRLYCLKRTSVKLSRSHTSQRLFYIDMGATFPPECQFRTGFRKRRTRLFVSSPLADTDTTLPEATFQIFHAMAELQGTSGALLPPSRRRKPSFDSLHQVFIIKRAIVTLSINEERGCAVDPAASAAHEIRTYVRSVFSFRQGIK